MVAGPLGGYYRRRLRLSTDDPLWGLRLRLKVDARLLRSLGSMRKERRHIGEGRGDRGNKRKDRGAMFESKPQWKKIVPSWRQYGAMRAEDTKKGASNEDISIRPDNANCYMAM